MLQWAAIGAQLTAAVKQNAATVSPVKSDVKSM